jgi:hypothetical protein
MHFFVETKHSCENLKLCVIAPAVLILHAGQELPLNNLEIAMHCLRHAVLISLLCLGTTAYAQFPFGGIAGTPSVPDLLGKLESARYTEIPRGKVGAMSLAAVIRGFSDAGCQFDSKGPSGNANEVIGLTQALMREMGGDGAMSMGFVQTFPNYADTLRFVGEQNCASPRVQKTMRNLLTHLRARFDPDAPPPKPAPAAPVTTPPQKPLTAEDKERIQRNGCERERKRLAELRARDRGDARSAAAIARYEEQAQRACNGL